MDTIIVLDFGSQYTQLIARRIRELNIYCEIHPYNKIPVLTQEVKGVVFSGSPYSCNAADAPVPDMTNIKGKLPLLAVCYGAQYLANTVAAVCSSLRQGSMAVPICSMLTMAIR